MDSSIHPNALAAAIEQWQSNVLDSDIVVDDSRADLQRALEAYRSAVRERQRAVTT